MAELAAVSNWAGLLRYAIAHGLHMPAVKVAIDILRKKHHGQGYAALRSWLAEYWKAPLATRAEFKHNTLRLNSEQRAVLTLLHTLPKVAVCDMAERFPTEQVKRLLQNGQKVANLWLNIATQCQDEALKVVALTLIAKSHIELVQPEAAITIYEAALVIRRKLVQSRPSIYLTSLVSALTDQGTLHSKLRRFDDAVKYLEEALFTCRRMPHVPQTQHLTILAKTLNNLGTVQDSLSRFEDAYSSYAEALCAFRTLATARPDQYLHYVSGTLNNIGTVQSKMMRQLEAVESFKEALAISRKLSLVPPDVNLADIAMILNNLGMVLVCLAESDAASTNFREALVIRRKLAVARPEKYLADVALTLNNLASSEIDSARYQNGLTDRARYLPNVADAVNDLGNSQVNVMRFEDAIVSYGEALASYRELAGSDPNRFLPKVLYSLNNMSIAQRNLSRFEDARASVEEAVQIGRRLAADDPTVYLPIIAGSLNNLGSALRGVALFREAALSYEESLGIWRSLTAVDPEVYMPDLALVLSNLGVTQAKLTRLEDAVDSLEEALVIRRKLAAVIPEVYMAEVAMTLNNLGDVQRELARPKDASASLEEALEIQRVLAVANPDVYTPAIAMTLNNLGIVLTNAVQLEEALAYLNEAIGIWQTLAVSSPDVYMPSVAMALNNIGEVQRKLARFEVAIESLNQALAAYRLLAAERPSVYLTEVAGTLMNLGIVEASVKRFDGAVASFEESLVIYNEMELRLGSIHLISRVRLQRLLADLVILEHPQLGWPDYGRARGLLRNASLLAAEFRGLFIDPRERIRVQQEQRGLYARRVEVCLKCAELYNDATAYEEALEAAEGARSRALLDALAQQLLPEEAPLELRQKFQSLQRDLRRAQRRLHQELETQQAHSDVAKDGDGERPNDDDASPTGNDTDVQADNESDSRISLGIPRRVRGALTLSKSLANQSDYRTRISLISNEVQQQVIRFRDLVSQLRSFDPQFQPDVAIDSFRMHTRGSLFPADKRTAYVHLLPKRDQYLAMILTQDQLIPVSIPQWTPEKIRQMTKEMVEAQFKDSSKAMMAALKQALPQILIELQFGLQASLLPALAGVGLQPGDRLVLVPDPMLSFLPLHAVPANEQQSLGELYEVASTPSLSILQQCITRKRPNPTRLFAVEDPTRTLAGPALESALVKKHFSECQTPTVHDHSTLYEAAREAHVFYWMGHAQFSFQVPYWSGLLLKQSGVKQIADSHGQKQACSVAVAPTDLVTFTDIDCGLTIEQCSLAILSGCQSGLALTGKGNESVSLVSAFLNAGAKCVVASLWPVDDGACVLTMQRFMTAWRQEGQSISMALQTAQQWLRTLTAQQLADWADQCPELQEPRFRDLQQNLRWRIAENHKDAHGPQSCPYDSPYYWAPFVAVGQSWPE